MEGLTLQQAFAAMVLFLEDYYSRTQSDDIAALLSDLNTDIWADHTTGDPAAWEDWVACVHKILMPDTPENRQLLQDLVENLEHHQGTDQQ